MLRPGVETNSIPTNFRPGPPQRSSALVNSPSLIWFTRMNPSVTDSSSTFNQYENQQINYSFHRLLPTKLTKRGYSIVRRMMVVLPGRVWTTLTSCWCRRNPLGLGLPHSWTRCANTQVITNCTNRIARRVFIFNGQVCTSIGKWILCSVAPIIYLIVFICALTVRESFQKPYKNNLICK